MSERDLIRNDLYVKFRSLKGVGDTIATKCADSAMRYLDSLVEKIEPDTSDDPRHAFPWSLFDAAQGQRVEEVEIVAGGGAYIFIVQDPEDGIHACCDPGCSDNRVDYISIPDQFKQPAFAGSVIVRPSDA